MNSVAGETGARPRLPIDPRIKERRIAVQRDEGRRRLRVLVTGVAVACLAGGAVAATHSAALDVDHVAVAGAAQTPRADILRTTGLDHRRYLIDVRGGALAQRLEVLPWVQRATVQRHW